jgi:signal transduction histidine kinase
MTEPYPTNDASGDKQIQRRHQELKLLHSLSVATGDALQTPAILDTLESLLQEQLALPGGVILLHDRARDQWRVRRHWGATPALLAAFRREALAAGHLEAVYKRQETLFLADATGERPWSQLLAERPSWQSVLAVPLLAKNDALGLFCIFTQTPFSREKITFFETVGREVGVALHNARLFRETQISRKRLQRLAQKIFSTQEEERQRVARALHDEAGQALTGLKITLEMVRDELPAAHSAREKLSEAIKLAESTMGQIRDLAHDLRPAALDNLGLNTTLRSFCRDFAKRTHLQIEYRGTEASPLPDAVEICLYRLLQEALTNVARHAAAERVTVTLRRDDATVSLSVKDDGRGFDVAAVMEAAQGEHGIGLSGMTERVESVGGQLVIESEPGAGTRLVAWIPL